jgi:transcription-repair coupling factor (superfamily II helicase)
MEIRGAGELLGKDQSGQMQEIGFGLYNELLERAIRTLKPGKTLELIQPPLHGPEVDLQTPALIPEDYLPDVHTRLVLYKRLAEANNSEELRELQIEMIDRFGLLPEATKTLFAINALRLKAAEIGIRKIEASTRGGRIYFQPQPKVDPMAIINLIQQQPSRYQFDGQEKLRFVEELPDTRARLEAIEKLLSTLATKKAA